MNKKSQPVASSYKLEYARFSTLLRIQDRAECGKGTELHGWGDTTQKKLTLGGEDTAHTFLMENN